jgi:hypothetical protein
MKIEKLSKELFEKATKHGVETIELRFSGGDDQGYLNVVAEGENLTFSSVDSFYLQKLQSEIEEWAWNVYDYSGAGDGTDYGDTIVYDLKNKTATHSYWEMRPHKESDTPSPLEIE